MSLHLIPLSISLGPILKAHPGCQDMGIARKNSWVCSGSSFRARLLFLGCYGFISCGTGFVSQLQEHLDGIITPPRPTVKEIIS